MKLLSLHFYFKINCPLQHIQLYFYILFTKGCGIFSKKNFEKGDFLLEYKGKK